MVSQNLEKRVRLHMILIYLVAAIAAGAMITYLYQAQQQIEHQRNQLAQQQTTWALSQQLIGTVHESQALFAQYIATQNPIQHQEFNLNLEVIDRVIDTLNHQSNSLLPFEKVHQIVTLLNQQSHTAITLKRLFEARNPLLSQQSNWRIQPNIPKKDSVFVRSYTQRKIISPAPKKSFFKRIANAFTPTADSITEIVHQRKDSLIVALPEPTTNQPQPIQNSNETQAAHAQQLHSIETNLSQLITNNQAISTQIATLLFQLQKSSFATIDTAINQSEQQLKRNYTHSVLGTVAAFIVILLLSLFLLNNVHKAQRTRLEVEAANLRIRQVTESRHKLLLSISHDLKTPITSLLGLIDDLTDQQCPQRHSMHYSAHYMLNLLENLLDYSALEQGALATTHTPFAPHTLFTELAEIFQPIAQQKGLCLAVDIELPQNLILSSDPIKLKQVAANLLSNALKYTHEGGVGWTVSYKKNILSLEVTDTGVGIPQSLQSKLFQPFSRIEQNNTLAQGSGLGLFIVKGIVDLLKGTLSIESEQGKGSRFTVIIPIPESKFNTNTKPLIITIVDDDPTIAQLLSKRLEQLGHTPKICAPNAPIPSCDLIITDYEMGEYTGIDILNRAGTTPVVLMTGRSDLSKTQALQFGFTDYLPKPFTTEFIRMIVGEATTQTPSMIGDDTEFKKRIETLFQLSIQTYTSRLEEAIQNDQFTQAQALCHKMIPTFTEFGYNTLVPKLRKIDQHRNAPPYPEWKEEVKKIVEEIANRAHEI